MFAAGPVKTLAGLALISAAVHAAVVTYDWNITYVNTNPDGLMDRRVIGINGQFPYASLLLFTMTCEGFLYALSNNHLYCILIDHQRLMSL